MDQRFSPQSMDQPDFSPLRPLQARREEMRKEGRSGNSITKQTNVWLRNKRAGWVCCWLWLEQQAATITPPTMDNTVIAPIIRNEVKKEEEEAEEGGDESKRFLSLSSSSERGTDSESSIAVRGSWSIITGKKTVSASPRAEYGTDTGSWYLNVSCKWNFLSQSDPITFIPAKWLFAFERQQRVVKEAMASVKGWWITTSKEEDEAVREGDWDPKSVSMMKKTIDAVRRSWWWGKSTQQVHNWTITRAKQNRGNGKRRWTKIGSEILNLQQTRNICLQNVFC